MWNKNKKGLLFVLSAPAGTGKTTLVKKLQKECPSVVQSVSSTTRPIRPGEVEGEDYLFISREQFEKKSANDEFLEYVELYGDYYGTSRQWVSERLDSGKHVILVIDKQGALKLMNKTSCVMIFMHPPSFDELKRRLLGRQTESHEVIEKRLKWAESEIEKSKLYDYNIVNDNIDDAYLVLKSIVVAEEHRTEI
jgi:guanylate kinase